MQGNTQEWLTKGVDHPYSTSSSWCHIPPAPSPWSLHMHPHHQSLGLKHESLFFWAPKRGGVKGAAGMGCTDRHTLYSVSCREQHAHSQHAHSPTTLSLGQHIRVLVNAWLTSIIQTMTVFSHTPRPSDTSQSHASICALHQHNPGMCPTSAQPSLVCTLCQHNTVSGLAQHGQRRGCNVVDRQTCLCQLVCLAAMINKSVGIEGRVWDRVE